AGAGWRLSASTPFVPHRTAALASPLPLGADRGRYRGEALLSRPLSRRERARVRARYESPPSPGARASWMGARPGHLVRERLALEARPAALDALHAALERFWSAAEQVGSAPPGREWRLRFETGLAEVLGNVVRHAYPVPAGGRLELELRLYADRAEARLLDHGLPFTQPDRPPEPLPEGGF